MSVSSLLRVFPSLLLCLLLLLSLSSLPVSQSLTLPRVLSSHMVLQRDLPATLWGTAAPNSPVSVTLDDDSAHPFATTANGVGNWSVSLPPHNASTERHRLAISGDGSTVVLEDVVFGDVFFCSGQSNMEFVLQDAFNFTAEIEDSGRYPFLRLFTVADDQSAVYLNDTRSRFLKNESWVVSSPQYTNGTEWLYYSALCFLYGRNIHRELGQKVPVGLIESCYGGTPIITWMDVDAVQQCNHTMVSAEVAPPRTEEEERLTKAIGNYGGPHGPKAPYLLWNAMVEPIVRYKLKAILWYQGEDDASQAPAYECRFPAMIQSWRKHWQQPELPFYFALLAGYVEGGGHWAPTRAAQLSALRLPNVGVQSAHDLGDRLDAEYSDIHSRNKSILATRLSDLALFDLYGRSDIVAYGPVPAALEWPAGEPTSYVVRQPFVTNGTAGRYSRGLHLLGTAECQACCGLEGSPVQFVLSNKTTVRAAVSIQESTLVATATLGAGVRVLEYWLNYEAYPECAVYNAAGFPVIPFAVTHPALTTPSSGARYPSNAAHVVVSSE